MTSRLARIACGALAIGLAGCEAAKSSNPTSPTVAGPIPGVNITAPALIEPAQGFKFDPYTGKPVEETEHKPA